MRRQSANRPASKSAAQDARSWAKVAEQQLATIGDSDVRFYAGVAALQFIAAATLPRRAQTTLELFRELDEKRRERVRDLVLQLKIEQKLEQLAEKETPPRTPAVPGATVIKLFQHQERDR